MNKEVTKKILGIFFKIFLPAFFIFSFLLFPINDLRSVISQKIAQATQNQVAVEFAEIGLNVIPKPSIELQKVSVSTQQFSTLKMASLQISPSILGLITFKPGVTLSGENLFGGNFDFSLRAGGKNAQSQTKQLIQVNAKDIALNEVLDFLNVGFKGNGKLQLSLDSDIDPNGQDTEANVKLDSRDIRLPANTIPTQIGAVALPPVQISVLQIDGDLKKNKLRITRGVIGKDGDTLNGSIEGTVDVRVMAGPQGPQVVPTGYDLILRLRIQNQFLSGFALQPILEGFKSAQTERDTIFNLSLSATNLRSPPTITKIQ